MTASIRAALLAVILVGCGSDALQDTADVAISTNLTRECVAVLGPEPPRPFDEITAPLYARMIGLCEQAEPTRADLQEFRTTRIIYDMEMSRP